MEHDLLVIFKGFSNTAAISDYEVLLQDLPHRKQFVRDTGYDITAYLRASENSNHAYFFFLNSFSVILGDGWLRKVFLHAQRPDVGLAGATGSWMSLYSGVLHEQGKPNAYNHILGLVTRPRTFELSTELAEYIQKMPPLRRWLWQIYYYGVVGIYYRIINSLRFYFADKRRWRGITAENYEEFPTPHLRTNAFMVSRDLIARLQVGRIRTKNDAHRFESGKKSLTKQILAMGLKVVVVGRDGLAYEKEEWPQSETFLIGDQRNLLVSDNQTRRYAEASPEMKAIWSRLAWGDAAE
jgi:hypothetical protein